MRRWRNGRAFVSRSSLHLCFSLLHQDRIISAKTALKLSRAKESERNGEFARKPDQNAPSAAWERAEKENKTEMKGLRDRATEAKLNSQ